MSGLFWWLSWEMLMGLHDPFNDLTNEHPRPGHWGNLFLVFAERVETPLSQTPKGWRMFGRHGGAADNMFASRATTHEPSGCFRKMERALPVRTVAVPPAMGTMRTVSAVQQ